MRGSILMLPVAIAALTALQTGPADARIRCVEGFQVVNGSRISTPYCQDTYLAKVARGYGRRVSAASVRNNPTVKRRLCHFIGHDIRVRQSCAGTGFDVRGRPY